MVMAAAVMPVTAAIGVGTTLLEKGFAKGIFISTLVFMLFVVALGLGAIGAIQEFTDKTAHFLFTKPRPRFYFVWIGWVVGCTEILAIALVNVLVGGITLAHYGKIPFGSVVFDLIKKQDVAPILIDALFIYSLTYSLTAVLRNGLKGLGASMGSLAILQALAVAIRMRWNVNVPLPPQPIGSLSQAISNLVWMLVALLLVFSAQLVVERVEI
jgi:hypothetical protein